ncbi:MAG: DUF4835 family protein [Chloroherpetonaceae bacterium]|nr:DUF4835 family protein [Chloroherpetonaceae bacterium]
MNQFFPQFSQFLKCFTKRLIAILAFLVFGSTGVVFGQEIQCDVKINVDQLPSDARKRIENFRQVVMDYINTFRWTNLTEFQTPEDRIQVRIEFQFTAADINASPPRYSAQVAFSSSRPIYRSLRFASIIRLFDTDLDFLYDDRQGNLIHNDLIFNPLPSFLDYYAYIIIGYDQDTFEKFGGTVHYERARRILQLAQANNTSPRGWRLSDGGGINRQNLVDELLDPRFNAAREAFYDYHYNALDEFHGDPIAARRKVADAVNAVVDTELRFPRSMFVRRFFDSKFLEIGEIFRTSDQQLRREVYESVIKADPSRRQKYEEMLIQGK